MASEAYDIRRSGAIGHGELSVMDTRGESEG
jgi:hypothetical protein